MKELRDIIRLFAENGAKGTALATLVRVQGSSYRRAGARMAICADGTAAGSLSAGCIEEEVAKHALEVLCSGEPQLIAFDTRRRFGCNGSIEIFIERVTGECMSAVSDDLVARRDCIIETIFESESAPLGTRVIPFETDQTEGTFVQVVRPALRLLIVGDGPDAEALRAQSALLGWECECVPSIATWDQPVDDRTAAVIATHNFGRDCAALRHLLPLGLRYVGVIGPRRRRDELLVDVLDTGAAIKSDLFAPAGLHLGAEAAEEIALSVVAEIQAVFTRASGVRLRDHKAPIHSAAERGETCAELAR